MWLFSSLVISLFARVLPVICLLKTGAIKLVALQCENQIQNSCKVPCTREPLLKSQVALQDLSGTQLPGEGTGVEPAVSPSVPMTSLRFGSFEPASAPPRLWSDRVDSEDLFECTLPLLEFEGADGSGRLVRDSSARTLDGVGVGEPEVASLSLPPLVVEAPVRIATCGLLLGGGGRGRRP